MAAGEAAGHGRRALLGAAPLQPGLLAAVYPGQYGTLPIPSTWQVRPWLLGGCAMVGCFAATTAAEGNFVLLRARGPQYHYEDPLARCCGRLSRLCFASAFGVVQAEPSKQCMSAFLIRLHDTVARTPQPASYGVVSGINFGTATSTNTSAPLAVLAGGRTTGFSIRFTGALARSIVSPQDHTEHLPNTACKIAPQTVLVRFAL